MVPQFRYCSRTTPCHLSVHIQWFWPHLHWLWVGCFALWGLPGRDCISTAPSVQNTWSLAVLWDWIDLWEGHMQLQSRWEVSWFGEPVMNPEIWTLVLVLTLFLSDLAKKKNKERKKVVFGCKMLLIFQEVATAYRGLVRKAYLHFQLNILLPLSSYTPPKIIRALISPCLRSVGPLLSADLGIALAAQSSLPSLAQGAKVLLSNTRLPQPIETARGTQFWKWDLLFKYFLQCTESWKRGQ